MKDAKEAIPAETEAIRRRIKKLAAMRRVEDPDCNYIVAQLDLIDARVAIMPEHGRTERREF